LYESSFRATLRPRGFQYIDEMMTSLDPIMHSHLVRDLRSRLIYKRLFFYIPYSYISQHLMRSIRLIRNLRLTYALLYWKQGLLSNLFWRLESSDI
jgi:hypothetical protein